MSDKVQESLSSFMKKQATEKLQKKATPGNPATNGLFVGSKGGAKEGKNSDQEELDEAAQLEEAKKASKGKAAKIDPTEMYKKLVIQTIAKFILLFSILLVVFIGLVRFGPAIVDFIKVVIHNIFFSFFE